MNHYASPISAQQIRDLVGDAPCFLEVGAHDGTDSARFLAAMPGIRLYCFEPDPRPIARFKELIGDDPRVTLYEQAVADINGLKRFYPSTGKAGHMDDWDYSGSLQKPTGHLTHSPNIHFKEPVPVPCIRLDTWHRINLHKTKIDFAHIDIQGAQRVFLAGAQKTLPLIHFLYIEAHHNPLYEDETTQEELIALLPGFEPLAIYERDNIFLENRNFQ